MDKNLILWLQARMLELAEKKTKENKKEWLGCNKAGQTGGIETRNTPAYWFKEISKA